MRFRVLGCHGGESATHRASSFLIDEHLMLDAGAAARSLTVQEQIEVDHIVISHVHLDHIRDIGLLADNVIGARKKPLEIHCTDFTADALFAHVLNNVVWPDFTKIPNPGDPEKRPTLRVNRFRGGSTLEIGPYQLKTVPVNHTVETHAMFVRDKTGTIVYSGDTGPCPSLYDEVNKVDDLRAFITEVSFPNAMEGLAKVSGHLTPAMLQSELKQLKLKAAAPILIYHLKPAFYDVVKQQLAELKDSRITILKPMDEFTF
jgi:ribonuclease BN (tRNA processing enzyme)